MKFNLKWNLLIVFVSFFQFSIFAQKSLFTRSYNNYVDLQESAENYRAIPMKVRGTSRQVTFGAEKEVSHYDPRITKVLSPTPEQLEKLLSRRPKKKQNEYLSAFLKGLQDGSIVENNVISADGTKKDFSLDFLKGKDLDLLDLEQKKDLYKLWLSKTDGSPFSFINTETRFLIYEAKFAGLDGFLGQTTTELSLRFFNFLKYVPIFGDAEKYIESAEPAHWRPWRKFHQWEILFKPLDTYGEFEGMIKWFRETLKDEMSGELMEAPGHNRLVFPKPNATGARLKKIKGQMVELYKGIQALVILRSVEGGSGIQYSKFKQVYTDEHLRKLKTFGHIKGVIRLEEDRFVDNSWGIEFRVGPKSPQTRRLLISLITARIAGNDLKGLANYKDWTLVPFKLKYGRRSTIAKHMAEKFDIDVDLAKKALKNIDGARKLKDAKGRKRYIKRGFQVLPFWNWSDAPYLKNKKAHINKITRELILKLAATEDLTAEEYLDLQRKWVTSADITRNLQKYLEPSKIKTMTKSTDEIMKVARKGKKVIDVNKIDLGIEFTTRFPIRSTGEFLPPEEDGGKPQFVKTIFDMSPENKETVLKDLGESFVKKLEKINPKSKGNIKIEKRIEQDSHGHGLSVSFKITDSTDSKDKYWIVEWDGIGRSYQDNGRVIKKSARGGHIEISTPKFNPSFTEIEALYKTFSEHDLISMRKMGGGHLNIDALPFDNNPKALARFLTLYHANRDIISLLFQHPNRLLSAQPTHVSKNLEKSLRNFDGTNEDLKKTLYNEKYFNNRRGRKTQYGQVNLNSYFQDVIPENMISEDYDILNPTVKWRRQFTVDPMIRKIELRLFDSFRDEYEAALAIKVLRSMMDVAFNSEEEINEPFQNINYQKLAKNPALLEKRLSSFANKIGIDPSTLRGKAYERSGIVNHMIRNGAPLSFHKRIKFHRKVSHWGKAVQERPQSEGISSNGRAFKGSRLKRLISRKKSCSDTLVQIVK